VRVSDFHFDLPEELIAQHPPPERGASRMLVMEQEQGSGNSAVQRKGNREPGTEQDCDAALAGWSLRDAQFRELPEFLHAGDLLVLNDSRVIPARLFARRAVNPTSQNRDVGHPNSTQEPSRKIEVLLTERVNGPVAEASSTSLRDAGHAIPVPNVWRALVKPGRKVRVGERLEFFEPSQPDVSSSPTFQNRDVGRPILTAEVIEAGERGERTLRFAPLREPDTDFNAVLARIGHMPLPPYIRHGNDEAADRERYQTVYARDAGSAAAPTAGLHFTPEMLDALRARGVEIAYVTLHVGLGTFQPVRVDRVEEIKLHAERYTLPPQTADALRRALREGRRIVAVGTTTTRTLEHIAHEALAGFRPPEQSSEGAPGSSSHISTRCGAPDPGWIERIAPHSGETSIFISPGHRFRIVSGLLTNFHLPQSTLLMLVSAFAADRIARSEGPRSQPDADLGRLAVLATYAHAVRERYRFYSYGDCMTIV